MRDPGYYYYAFGIGDEVWYLLDSAEYQTGVENQYTQRQSIEVVCVVVNITDKRVMLRKVGDPETVKPIAVLPEKARLREVAVERA